MQITKQSVSRPIFTIMIVLIVMILGGVSLSRLPIDLMPELTYPTLTVSTNYENASPEEMEELVTRIVEEAVAAVPGVEEITSISSEGQSSVRVSFSWGTDLDAASNDIRDRLDRITGRLPDNADRPQLRKFDAAQFPILIMGASSRLDPVEMRLVIDNQIKQRIERIPGVAAVDIWGGLEREIQVNVHPDRVRALGFSLEQIVQAIREANINVPAGTIEQNQFEVTLRTPGEFSSIQEIRSVVIAVRDGAPIYLAQVADVLDGHQRQTRIIRINGEPGVRLAVRKQAGTNTVQVAQAVLRELDRIHADVPQIQITPIIDTSKYIQQSINNVGRSILFGGTLAIFVLLFFLRNIRSTLVIAMGIPISIIATFTLIYFGGFTLNLMTLGGLALGVGMMVDNAIVVLENIYRLREKGGEGRAIAVQGTEEVSAAVTASTITTLVIFLPMVFLEGVAGVMFRQLAYVVAFALICSLLVALTVVPMLSARLLKPVAATAAPDGYGFLNRAFVVSGRMFHALEKAYLGLLKGALRHRLLVLALVVVLFGGALSLIPRVGTEFMPSADEGEVRVNVEMEVGTRLDVVDAQMRRIERMVQEMVPEAENMVVNVGASGWRAGGGARGEIRVALVPAAQRTRSSEQIAADLRPALTGIPGTVVRTRAGQGLFIFRMGAGDGDTLAVEVRGWDLQRLDALAAEVSARMERVDGITDVRVSREAGARQELVRIDRNRAADLGLSATRIARTLETAIAGTRAANYREGGYEYRILVKLAEAERMSIEDILDMTLTNDAGEQVLLRNVVVVESGRGPTQIDRKDQQRIASISAAISGRDLGSVVADLREHLREIPVPRDYEIVFAGDYEEQREAFSELALALILALLLVYMVMACLYESLLDPLVVMFAVPLAAIGVVLILLATGTTFNVQSFIGCIMLGGIVVNNAILIVDQSSHLRRNQGMAAMDAVLEAGRRRLRPILMTSLTTAFALTPLALGWGEGADAQAPMARVVIGGLISSSLITLVVIPVIYTLFYRVRGATRQTEQSAAPA
ncbi:hydrophobic/amphiphilic exporter-1, HAE1 family [Desulfonatronum thiosulfatophilum]|uniref:Hydrophobic/amphiphilic exporter-1, HAE1 family n=1 Tax=Desulfonatronum thiosulfatophilum TaxID=617002 RepID=A0A1G6ET85_9BACT|nr:efflux RND transporter permease subunit [Desulfonatronum thiosulfatophilum]SDB60667.1 hydrophobic/amphiphilic exporter-1, HAE1 family [Desulfonatronum thiosulfatophilum]